MAGRERRVFSSGVDLRVGFLVVLLFGWVFGFLGFVFVVSRSYIVFNV